MKYNFYGFGRTLRAEWLKLKGSGIWLLIAIMGVIFPLLGFIIGLFTQKLGIVEEPESLPFNWFESIFESSVQGFAGFFFPLALIILAARLAGLEHKTDTWKLIETQPVHRLSIWWTKWVAAAVLSAFVIIIFIASTIILKSLFLFIKPASDAAEFVFPSGFILQMAFRLWLASLGLLTIQIGISILIRSTVWPIVIGISALIITNMIEGGNNLAATLWPFALPIYSGRFPHGSEMGNWLLPAEWQGLLWVLLAPLAYMLYHYRGNLKSALSDIKKWQIPAVAILLLGIGSYLVQKPRSLTLLEGKTVIAGKIQAPNLSDSISILTLPLEMEIARGPISPDGSFHLNIPLTGSVEELLVRISPANGARVYAGRGDSLFIDWVVGSKPGLQKVDITGTAIATNQYFSNNTNSFNMVGYYLSEDYTGKMQPEKFYEQLVDEWKEENKKPSNFKTADGYALGRVMLALQQKLVAVKYLDYAYFQYPEKYNINAEDEELKKALEKVEPILEKVAEFDSTLIGWPDYHVFLEKWLIRDLPKSVNKDSAYLARLLQQSPGAGRDRLLYEHCLNRLGLARDSISRSEIMKDVANISNAQFRNALFEKNMIINRLRKGQPAPLFAAHLSDNKEVSLTDLKGKFVAVDVWATWCGPCRTQSPVFEKMAEKYKDQNITFLALSVDINRPAWDRFLARNDSRILQWRAISLDEMRQKYGIASIPRFILIDPNGLFVNAQMPYPTDANFEELLRQALGLKAEEG